MKNEKKKNIGHEMHANVFPILYIRNLNTAFRAYISIPLKVCLPLTLCS